MAKFHLNEQGDPGRCRAWKGKCPFGSNEEHYDSLEAARKAYEARAASFTPIPHKTVEKAFLNIPLAEEARIYRILREEGIEYLPWRGREQELEAAYEPWKTISYEELARRNGRLKDGDESLLTALRNYDKSVAGTVIEGYAYERSKQASAREALARYRASTTLRGFDDGLDCYRVLPSGKSKR